MKALNEVELKVIGVAENEDKRRRRLLLLLILLLQLLFLVCALFIRYLQQPAPLPELIAPQADVNYPPHYLFSIYGVDRPVGVGLTADGARIYVAESGGLRLIQIFDREGAPIGSFAPPDTGPGERSPVYIAVDSQERLFITDRLQHAIFVYDRDGNYIDSLVSPDLALSEYVSRYLGGQIVGVDFSFNVFRGSVSYQTVSDSDGKELPAPTLLSGWAPLGVRIDAADRILVTDVIQDSNCVWAFSVPAEPMMTSWHEQQKEDEPGRFGTSGQGHGQFLFPNSAVSDSRARIYVSDGNNGRISVWREGEILFHFGTGRGEGTLSLPRGMYLDQRDRLHVVDAVGQHVLVYDVSEADPVFLFQFGGFGMGDGLFNYPNDIALDNSGRLYIADRENNRVQVWSY